MHFMIKVWILLNCLVNCRVVHLGFALTTVCRRSKLTEIDLSDCMETVRKIFPIETFIVGTSGHLKHYLLDKMNISWDLLVEEFLFCIHKTCRG